MRALTSLGGLLACLMMAAPAGAQAPVPPPPSWSPSLDCNTRIYAVDSLICEDAALLTEARKVEAAYRQAIAQHPAALEALQADQLAWSKQRNRCVFERKASRCVRRLQASRIRALAGR
jgi:uncharacterized protein